MEHKISNLEDDKTLGFWFSVNVEGCCRLSLLAEVWDILLDLSLEPTKKHIEISIKNTEFRGGQRKYD